MANIKITASGHGLNLGPGQIRKVEIDGVDLTKGVKNATIYLDHADSHVLLEIAPDILELDLSDLEVNVITGEEGEDSPF